MPFQKGGIGSLLGGAGMVAVGALLQDFGAQVLGSYGAIPGFLITIGAIGLCLDYAMQIIRAFFNDEGQLPYWKISSVNFADLLLPFLPIFMTIYYTVFVKLVYQFIGSKIINEPFTLSLFFNNLADIKSMIFFATFFPVVYFYLSLSPEGIGALFNPLLILQIIIKMLPSYLLLILFAFCFLIVSIKLNIRLLLLGGFFSYFLKFYLLQVFAILIGMLFNKRKEIFE